MGLTLDYSQVKEVYAQAAERGVAIPTFCAEDRETLEAILAAAYELGQEIGVPNLPVAPAWTCRYPGRKQMTLVTQCADPYLGMEMMHSDLQLFAGEHSPYRNLTIVPHLDHAFPWHDMDVLLQYADRFASVMCDASERPFEENIEITAKYVEQVKGKVLVEGGVDEVFEATGDKHKNEATTVEQARRFLSETGVDIIVPNVGTEHRATADKVKYNSRRAREISREVGKIMCLHGTSSVPKEDLSTLPQDGFVKINIFTILAVKGGQSVADVVLRNLGNIFTSDQMERYVADGILSKNVLSPDYAQAFGGIKPRLNSAANPMRRRAWFTIVKDTCKEYMRTFNYENYAR